MYSNFSSGLKRIFWQLGIDVRRSQPWSAQPHAWLKELEIRTILDIGANEGQSVKLFRELFPAANIISFEPLPDVHAQLMKNYGAMPNFSAVQVALGRSNGTLEMHRSSFHASSSPLKPTTICTETYPYTAGDTAVSVQQRMLDSLVDDGTLRIEYPLLAKIDVQGFELEAIRGGLMTLARARALILEVSFVELYEGQPLATEVIKELDTLGFDLKGILQIASHPITNHPIQADAYFVTRQT